MCGILAEINREQRVDLNEFNRLRDLMHHRGPDGGGTEVLNEGKIAFGHRRLSIIDLSEKGKQPMCNEDGTVWITFNGEIYNYPELKVQLAAKHIFRSSSDTEVLIHGFEEWGIEELLQRLKGMFAFTLWDDSSGKVYIARDRFGIKPLVYKHEADRLMVASELKAISKRKNFQKEISQEALADFFIYSYVPHPLTIFEGVFKLPPASYGVLDTSDFSLAIKSYWKLSMANHFLSDADAVERTRSIMAQVTKEHLLSDVPIGIFLSGGYDSTTLLSQMVDQGYKPRAFTISFPDSDKNEAEHAARIAKHFGVKHTIEPIPGGFDLLPFIEGIAPLIDEPFAGSSIVNNYMVSRMAARDLKVAFSGEGADEVFGGYKWHRKIERYYGPDALKNKVKNSLNGNFNQASIFLELYNRSMPGVQQNALASRTLNNSLKNQIRKRGLWHFARYYQADRDQVKNAQYIDTHSFVPNHCLFRADLTSMAHSLEVRVPFLDHEIYEFVYGLNRSVYMKPGVKKFLLEELIKPKVPREVLNMPKRGFSFHFSRESFNQEFLALMNSGQLKKAGILKQIDPNDRDLNHHLKLHLISLEYWFKYHFYD